MDVDDARIIELYFARDESAVSETRNKYGTYLAKTVKNILADERDCEEALSDTYIKTWNSIPPNRPAKMSVYLGRIARMTAIDLYRRNRSEKRFCSEYALSLDELEDCVSGNDSPEKELESKELFACVNAFLRTLGKSERVIFIRRYYYFDPLADIARDNGYGKEYPVPRP